MKTFLSWTILFLTLPIWMILSGCATPKTIPSKPVENKKSTTPEPIPIRKGT